MDIKWKIGVFLLLLSSVVNAGQACRFVCEHRKECSDMNEMTKACIDAPSFNSQAEFSDYVSSLSVVGKTYKQAEADLEKIVFFCVHLTKQDYRQMNCSRTVLTDKCQLQEQSFYVFLNDPKFKPEDISPAKLGEVESSSRYRYKSKLKIDRTSTWPLSLRPANNCQW